MRSIHIENKLQAFSIHSLAKEHHDAITVDAPPKEFSGQGKLNMAA